MTKPTTRALESLFAWEIDNAMRGESIPAPVRPPKLAKAMIEDGLILEAEATLPGRLPVTVKFHLLTEWGRYLYCEWASKQSDATAVGFDLRPA